MANEYGKLLASIMYKDRCTILRQMDTTDDIGADVFEMVAVYSAVPCKLGQTSQTSMNGVETDSVFTLKDKLRLSLHVDYDVMANDIIKVDHQGQIFTMRADTPFKYMSHQEITLIRDSEA